MSTLSSFLRRQRMRWYRQGISRRHGLRRGLAYYVAKHGFEIGDYSSGHAIVHHWGENTPVKVGRYCSVAVGTQLVLGGNHHTNYVATGYLGKLTDNPTPDDETYARGAIVLGSDVWIAKGVMILSGVTIGDGAVVGAGSVVLDNVAPYVIVQGNPARPIGKRFPDAIIRQLLELRWWDLDYDQVMSLRPLLQSDKIEAFFEACCKLRGISRQQLAERAKAVPLQPTPTIVPRTSNSSTESNITSWCTDYIAAALEISAGQIDPNVTFERLGMDSVMRASLIVALEEFFDIMVTPDDIAERPTIAALARHLAERVRHDRSHAAAQRLA